MTECHKELQGLMDQHVSVVTNDGRTIFGTLKGLDQKLNVILEECKERVFSKEEGVEEVRLSAVVAVCFFWQVFTLTDSLELALRWRLASTSYEVTTLPLLVKLTSSWTVQRTGASLKRTP